MAKERDFAEKKVVTPLCRFSYAHVFTPKAFPGAEPKFSVTCLIPKTQADGKKTDMSKMLEKAFLVRDDAFGSDKAKWPKKGVRMPFIDGDKEGNPESRGCWVVRASSKKAPQVLGKDRQPIVEQSDFYSGCYGHASLVAYSYEVSGNSGVSFALLAVMKTKDGQPFGGNRNAADDFADCVVEDESSDDASNYAALEDAADMGLDA